MARCAECVLLVFKSIHGALISAFLGIADFLDYLIGDGGFIFLGVAGFTDFIASMYGFTAQQN